MRSNGGLKGGCTLIDHASDIKIKCLDVTAFAQTGNRVVFSGMAEVNGQPTHYRIEAVDETEPGGPQPMEYGDTSSEALASGIASLLSATVDYRAIREDSVDRAADRLAELL